jgi:hypothetical protein
MTTSHQQHGDNQNQAAIGEVQPANTSTPAASVPLPAPYSLPPGFLERPLNYKRRSSHQLVAAANDVIGGAETPDASIASGHSRASAFWTSKINELADAIAMAKRSTT